MQHRLSTKKLSLWFDTDGSIYVWDVDYAYGVHVQKDDAKWLHENLGKMIQEWEDEK